MQQISGETLRDFPQFPLNKFILWVGNNSTLFFFFKDETLLGDPKRERIFVLGSTSWNSRKTPGHSCCHSLRLLYSFAVVRNLSWAWGSSFVFVHRPAPVFVITYSFGTCAKKNEDVDVYVLPVYFSTLYTALKMVQKTSLSCISKKNILMLTFFS